MRRVWVLSAIAAVLCGPAVAAPAELQTLTPTSPWNLDYDVESCRLQRVFGKGDDRIVARFIKYGRAPGLEVILSGKSLAPKGRDRLAYTFAPGSEPQKVAQPLYGTSPEGVTDWQFSADFSPRPDGVEEVETAAATAEAMRREEASIGEIRSFQLVDGVAQPVSLELGKMAKPMAAMNQCLDNLVQSWGLDPGVQSALRSAPRPKSNPGRWINSSDYPVDLVRNGVSGRISFRLMVDAAGTVTNCTVQAIYTDPKFQKAVCPVLSRRARFDPAIAQDGTPVASVWSTSVLFVTGS